MKNWTMIVWAMAMVLLAGCGSTESSGASGSDLQGWWLSTDDSEPGYSDERYTGFGAGGQFYAVSLSYDVTDTSRVLNDVRVDRGTWSLEGGALNVSLAEEAGLDGYLSGGIVLTQGWFEALTWTPEDELTAWPPVQAAVSGNTLTLTFTVDGQPMTQTTTRAAASPVVGLPSL